MLDVQGTRCTLDISVREALAVRGDVGPVDLVGWGLCRPLSQFGGAVAVGEVLF